ncbi:hypothetical protein ACHAXA_006992 [Cyclostephanos tholiformis]|uniref:EngB-type G domain-containing protein n=1 Tax=Cyclostephanos tholiformis TaxID=382380 RepID=A0ABD3R3C5_9STRA
MIVRRYPSLFVSMCLVNHYSPKTCRAFTIGMNPSPRSLTPTGRDITPLSMARGGVHGKKTRMLNSTKKKKAHNPSVLGKHRKTTKRDQSSEGSRADEKQSSTSTKPKFAILGETKKSPPWQVLGKKDMIENVEAEIIRRERIRMGIDSPSAGNTNREIRKADVSGANRIMSTADRSMLSWKRFNPLSAPSDLTMVGAYLENRLPPSLGVPEVAFLGRSNVGKSSLLNKLVSKAGGDTARVGKTPGATAYVNLYALLGPKRYGGNSNSGTLGAKPILGFADLPGFGYARLSKDSKQSVEEAAERYLGKRRELALGILLVDSRREPNADDRAVLAALYDMGVPLIVVATKCDKLNANEVELAMGTIRDGLGLPDEQPLRISAVTGEGIRDLWGIILDACEMRVAELKLSIEEGRDDGGVMRLALDEEKDCNDIYDDLKSEEDYDVEYFEDGEDLVYDQGYDWVQSEGLSDVGGVIGDGLDDFYDEDDYVEDVAMKDEKWNKARRIGTNESLKSLNRKVNEMERRGEI